MTTMRKDRLRGVLLGMACDDADTVGAVTGALAGAVWGAADIHSRWLKPLAWGPRILGLADSLYERSL